MGEREVRDHSGDGRSGRPVELHVLVQEEASPIGVGICLLCAYTSREKAEQGMRDMKRNTRSECVSYYVETIEIYE